MATLPVQYKKKTAAHSKKANKAGKAAKPKLVVPPREIGAGEFKAKCLAIIDEVSESGQEVIITKRGKAMAKLIPFQETSVDSLIVGDPDDLINPIIPLEDWESLR